MPTTTSPTKTSIESTATTVWEGDLATGRGTTSSGSRALPDVEVTWASRTQRTPGTTSPEELLAAAHASCFCMALSHGLTQAGSPPARLATHATVTFVPGEGVEASRIVVTGRVPGLDQEMFERAAADAGRACPISQALRGISVSVSATLEQ